MTDTLTHNQATFTPQLYQSFDGALEAFFIQECPQLGGARTRQMLVQAIRQMVEAFFPATTNLRAGQTTWSAVHKDKKRSYGKTILGCPGLLDTLGARGYKHLTPNVSSKPGQPNGPMNRQPVQNQEDGFGLALPEVLWKFPDYCRIQFAVVSRRLKLPA